MRSGDPLTSLILFDRGFPDGAVTWELTDEDGIQISTGSITPAIEDVSTIILISGAENTLGLGILYGSRELRWSYTTGGLLVGDHERYDIEAFLPFGISRAGVRKKLGLTEDELADDDINLILAYSVFESRVTSVLLDLVVDSHARLLVREAVEALAALQLLPSLQVRLASKEVSGVSQFQRAKIDWAALAAYLGAIVSEGYAEVNIELDPTETGVIFLTVVRNPDPVTGVAVV